MKHEYMTANDGSLWRYPSPMINGQYYGFFDGVLLRENFARHHNRIESTADFKATLRAGPYVWPGGYPIYFYTSDGAALSFEAARENAADIIAAIRHGWSDGWRVIGIDVNWEDCDLYCDHTGKRIEAAYMDCEEARNRDRID